MNKYILIIFLLNANLLLSQSNEGEIEDAQILIEKNSNIILPKVDKSIQKIDLENKNIDKKPFLFDNITFIPILSNKKILIAACDTFRAAAVEQLENWAKKNNNGFIAGKSNQDPASVAYQATEEFGKENYDFLLIDTAGRLSNNTNLINQLINEVSII